MKHMSLSNIAAACGGTLYEAKGQENCVAAGVVLDSRNVKKDYIFIATKGERVDGHDFIDDVFDKGALAVICEKAPAQPKGPYILVHNSLNALKDIAKWYRMQLSVKVIGITGSVGKTSTKEFISSVLAMKYKVLKTEGNYNNEIGLPLTILKIREEHEVAVLEMGISNFGEMHRLSEIAQPDICVITNIGMCHLENLGSRQGILKAKSEIFDFMSEDGYVCLNGDDDMLTTLTNVKGKKPIFFGLGEHCEFHASNIVSKGLAGSTCEIIAKGEQFSAYVPLPGEHMVLNAVAATAVGSILSMTTKEIREGIKNVQAISGRSNILTTEKYTIIDDCYNANPVSMKAALNLLAAADTRKVAILGDMFELGDTEAALHKEIGTYAASKDIDALICVGKLSSNIYDGAEKIFKGNLIYFETRDDLIKALPSILKKNDTILVKASHGMGFDHIVKALIEK